MSQRTFCDVTQQDVESVLLPLGFKQIQIKGTIELVYAKRVHQGNLQLSLRTYTGINPDGHSRECGKDAMRLALFIRDDSGAIFKVGDDKRVNRIQTWKKNLQLRLDKWAEELMPKDTCSCGSPMVVRETRDGKRRFLGCVRYPVCKETRSI